MCVGVAAAVPDGSAGGLVGGKEVRQEVGGDTVGVDGGPAHDLVGLAGEFVDPLLGHAPLGGEATRAQALPLEAHLEVDDDGNALVLEARGLLVIAARALSLCFAGFRHDSTGGQSRAYTGGPSLPGSGRAGVRAAAQTRTQALM